MSQPASVLSQRKWTSRAGTPWSASQASESGMAQSNFELTMQTRWRAPMRLMASMAPGSGGASRKVERPFPWAQAQNSPIEPKCVSVYSPSHCCTIEACRPVPNSAL